MFLLERSLRYSSLHGCPPIDYKFSVREPNIGKKTHLNGMVSGTNQILKTWFHKIDNFVCFYSWWFV